MNMPPFEALSAFLFKLYYVHLVGMYFHPNLILSKGHSHKVSKAKKGPKSLKKPLCHYIERSRKT